MSFSEFVSMGGYGQYVWPCYGLAVLTLVWNVWAARRELQQQIRVTQRRIQATSEVNR